MSEDLSLPKCTTDVAKQYIGQAESTGHNDGPFVQLIQRWLEGPNAHWMDGQPWCCAFATWCIHMAAAHLGMKPLIPPCGSSTDLYAFLQKQGKALEKPIPNCLGFIRGEGGSPGKTHHHTFMVLEVHDEFVISVDGNWGNAVSLTKHLISECDFGEIC